MRSSIPVTPHMEWYSSTSSAQLEASVCVAYSWQYEGACAKWALRLGCQTAESLGSCLHKDIMKQHAALVVGAAVFGKEP